MSARRYAQYVSTLIYQYVQYVYNHMTRLGYPSSYGFTGFIESTTSWMSSLSNRNTNNTRSVTLRLSLYLPLILLKYFYSSFKPYRFLFQLLQYNILKYNNFLNPYILLLILYFLYSWLLLYILILEFLLIYY